MQAGIVRGVTPSATLIYYLVFISLTLVIEVILLEASIINGLTHQLQATGEPKLDSKEHGLGWFLDCNHLGEKTFRVINIDILLLLLLIENNRNNRIFF